MVILAAVASLAAALGTSGAAREGPYPILDPKRYASPSGQFVLEVDPSERFGAGSAKYRLLKDGVEAWSGERSFTFWDAVVTDAGISAGYAYTTGWHHRNTPGEFLACVLGPTGELVRRHAEPRKLASMDGAPIPIGRAVFSDPDRGRFVVRATATDNLGEAWWISPMAREGETNVVRPSKSVEDVGRLPFVVAARTIPSTPWTIVQWWKNRAGAVFTLHDPDLWVVWRFDLPEDYASPSERSEEYLMQDWIRGGNAVSTGTRAGSFSIQSVAGQEVIRFEAVQDSTAEHGCRVRELSREPHPIAFEPPSDDELPELELRSLGRITLGSAAAKSASPIHDVVAFDFDPAGGIEVIRTSGEDSPEFTWVRVGPTGALDREVRLDRLPFTDERRVAWRRLSDGRWLALASAYGPGGKARAWTVQPGAGEPKEIPDFECPHVDTVVPAKDGGFVVLGKIQSEYQMHSALVAFDRDGRTRWRIDEPAFFSHDEKALFSPSGVAVRADGTVLVVDSIRKLLQVFDTSGAFVRAIDLSAAWKTEAKYPCEVVAAGDGVVYVKDGGGGDRVVRMPAALDQGESLQLRYADGRTPAPNGYRIQVAPDGALWTTDGQELDCLDRTGLVVRIVGSAPEAGTPTTIDNAFVDAAGRILTLDARAKVIQVFDAAGEPTVRCKLEPTDDTEFNFWNPFASSGSGDVFFAAWKLGGYLRFDESGRRVGTEDFGSGKQRFQCAFPPRSDAPWILSGHEPEIRIPRAASDRPPIVRRPDRRWLRSAGSMTVAADGTFAILDGSSSSGGNFVPSAVCTYAADGTPRETVECPRKDSGSDLAVLDGWFALTGEDSILLLERHGERRGRFQLEASKDKNAWRQGFASPDGKELWVIDPKQRSLERFAMP